MHTEYNNQGITENYIDGTWLFPYYDEDMILEKFADHLDCSATASNIDQQLFKEDNISIEELPADLAGYLS